MNTLDFDWALARSFLAALTQGSLMGAARATGQSQPTLGRHIAELERQLGVLLFERTGRGLQPTAHALRLADAARAMEAGATAMSRLAAGASQVVQGRVRLSASQPVACVLLPPVLARLRERLPEVTVELVVSNTLTNLLRREADIALRMVRPDQSTLVAKRIAQVPISACAERGYLRRRGVPQRPEDLLRHDLIGGDREDDVTPGMVAAGFPAEALRFGLRTDDLMAQWAAVRAGLGVGFAADYVIRSAPEVQPVLPQLKLPRYPIWLTVHRELRTSARIRAVYEGLAEGVPAFLAGREAG
jgi:DNA-binding transcriptional LysR family regulator